MARNLEGIEYGIRLLGENEDTGVRVLMGAGSPGGNAYTDDAEVGSVFFSYGGTMWQKKTSGSGFDKWKRMANSDDLLDISWRSDKVKVLTSLAAPIEGGIVDATTFPDAESTITGATFALGDMILFGYGGTPVAGRVTSIAGNNLTITLSATHATYPVDPLSDNDAFIVRNYLPDTPANQEGMALVIFNGTGYVKLADIDWAIATGINLSATYLAAAGNVLPNDTVEQAIQKLDGNLDNVTSILGVDVQTATNMGSYTGGVLTANQSIKTNIQELVNASLGNPTENLLVTTTVALDSLLVDSWAVVEWILTAVLNSNKSQRKSMRVFAHNNGTTTLDATQVDKTVTDKLITGSFQLSVDVGLTGSGATQAMALNVGSTTPGVSVYATQVAKIKAAA